MSHIYFNPLTVTSPQRQISNVEVLFDGGVNEDCPYSIARVTYGGEDKIAIRWNVSELEWDNPDKKSGKIRCIGVPNSRGYPTWFILPHNLLNTLNLNQISNLLEQ